MSENSPRFVGTIQASARFEGRMRRFQPMPLTIQDSFEPYYAGKAARNDNQRAPRDQRAKSATTASSTIMPSAVARSRELPTGATRRSSWSTAIRFEDKDRPDNDS